jgi:hypothetical protein
MTKAGDHGRLHTDRIVLEQCFGHRRGVAESSSASRSSVRGSGDVYGMTNTCPG